MPVSSLLTFPMFLPLGGKNLHQQHTQKVNCFNVCILTFITIPVCTLYILRTSLELVCIMEFGDS